MQSVESVSKEPIAIIGLGCVMPDAPDVKAFWDNILAGRSSITEVPKDRWDPALYFSADKSQPDTTYTKIGGWISNDNFNGLDYRMPPSVVAQVDPMQRWALSATRQALLDAGYQTGLKADEAGRPKPLRPFDRNRCAVILGNAMGGELRMATSRRVYWPESAQAVMGTPEFQSLPQAQRDSMMKHAETDFKANFIPVTEDTMPGSLSNVASGRVANVFDLSGKNFTTDAACASSLAALDAAVQALQRRESDLVVWGGSDRSMDVSSYIQFSKIGALSPDGSRPFDAGANGFVMGEGCGIFILKRLADAERDGDKIYAVVRGVGSSSDGKGKGITAPNPAGQVKAVVRAYEDAEIDPATLGLIEAHGTSTPVGDPVELQSVHEAFAQISKTPIPPGAIAVGSVKGNIGHLKAGAGAAGLLKATLALHNKVLPPSIGVKTLNPRIDWAKAPFKVQTQTAQWTQPQDHPRRAAVSSFGFGGTNFHVVLEEHVPGRLKVRPNNPPMTPMAPSEVAPQSARSATSADGRSAALDLPAFHVHMKDAGALEAEAVVLDGAQAAQVAMQLVATKVDFTQTGQGKRLRDVFAPFTTAGLAAPSRVAFSVADLADVPKKLELAQKAVTNPAQARLAFQQGVFLGKGKPQGKVAFLFPGQGTQYVNMFRDLAQKYEVVRNTFHEADEILLSELDGVKLTDILWPTPNTPEAQAASEKKLQLTEYTQPAVLAADVAILRLLRQWGIEADVVAGHSLGEYGALVAAGVLTFGDALHAVAARGREMAHVEVPDLGKMASISGDWATVQSALAGMTEYVIPANKNCPSQTVIAGSSKGVDQAVALLQQKGLQAQMLPVSAAFHSAIVAPASKPLRNVLSRLNVQPPRIRVLSNVGAQPYQSDVEWIRDNLATQVASPVEWIDIVQRMYDEGVRTFIEVGPKLALTNFVRDILKEKPDAISIGSNHPKKGGVVHANELFAFLGAWGFNPRVPSVDDAAVYTAAFRDPSAAFRRAPSAVAMHAASGLEDIQHQMAELRHMVASLAGGKLTPTTGSQIPQMSPMTVSAPASQASAGSASSATSVSRGDIEAEVKRRLDAFGISLDDIGISGISVGLPGSKHALFGDDNWDRILRGENLIDSLPASERTKIADKNIVRLVKGTDGSAQFQVISDIAQVIQLAGRRGGFDIADYGVGKELAESLDSTFQYAIAAGLEALHDAGIPLVRTYLQTSQGGHLPKEWKLPEPMRDETGIVFASAFPGYDNLLRDVSRYLADKYTGRTRDELNQLYNELLGMVSDQAARDRLQTLFDIEFQRMGASVAESGQVRYEFNRKFLFNVLSMGHSQLAQLIGARGPNTQVNAACASTTQAIAIAEDWIRTGRARRVLVVGADDVTSDAMFEWIGAGFLASGAATTKADVKEAALPFDKRRHGMIVGMGAVGLVIEATPETAKRAMRPIARLLASRVSNSAFHGSRLDVDHIAGEMKAMLAAAGKKYGVTPEGIAAQTVFMSHETYTPARGGSASAEIAALRATFGARVNDVVVANTKGFTGHPQGAGIEDAIVLKCLQRGALPPIANYKEADPELGNLNLSKGGSYPNMRYALRLAAGFGSQVAMSLTELVARENERIADAPRYAAWLSEVSGLPSAKLEVVNRTLRIVDQGPPARKPKVEAKTVAPVATPAQPPIAPISPTMQPQSVQSVKSVAPSAPTAGASDVLPKLIDLVATKTGYPKDLLDPDLDMEADLGIDTVKQAELFGAIRDLYGLPQEQSVQIKDYPTLRKVAGYVSTRLGGASTFGTTSEPTSHSTSVPAAPASVAPPVHGTSTAHAPALMPATSPAPTSMAAKSVAASSPRPEATSSQGLPLPPSHSLDHADVLQKLTSIVATKTGYPTDLLDPNLDMEADLGIDTVKQAEVFGAIRELYGLPQEEGMMIKDYPTLAKVAGYVQSRLGGAVAPAASATNPPMTPMSPMKVQPPSAVSAISADASPKPAAQDTRSATPTATSSTTAGALDPATVLQKVTQLVAAKTGYPADMLEPDLDMEADLGIDTVKQAELFGEVRTTFGIPLIDGLLIKDYPTLRKVAGFVLQYAPTQAAKSAESAEAASSAVSAVSAAGRRSGIVRRAPTVRPQPTPGHGNAISQGSVLMLGDADASWTAALEQAGFKPTTERSAPVVGIMALALKTASNGLSTMGELFDAAKAHRTELSFVAVVTRQDGSHGLKHVRNASMAALTGLGKALKKELPDATVKTIDLHPETLDVTSLVMDEVAKGGRRTEIAFGPDGTRFVVEVAPQELLPAVADVDGKCIVVSGGAQGITVEMLAALAPQKPRFLLLGRTELPEEAAAWAALDGAGWKALESRTIDGMKSRGERVTPVSIQKAMAPMQKAAEVKRNLHRLMDLGAEVLYAPVDVTNASIVGEAVAWARGQWGRIDGVLHAAGVEISKDLASKDRAQFDQVFGIKANGWKALMDATSDDKLSFVAAFGSVAGRFGNIGQTDYSAANEYLCKAVKQEATRRKCNGFTIAWGPWGEVGMATKGSILQIMHASGVTPIPTADGVAAFLAELATPGIRESVVAGTLGAIDADAQVVEHGWDMAVAVANELLANHGERFRLLDEIVECTPERRLVATLVLDQARNPGIADHKVDGVPYLPGVFGLEAFAEAASLLVSQDARLVGAEDIRFASPMKQLKAAPVTGTITAEVRPADGNQTLVACRLTTQFVGPDGRPHGEPRLHFEATLRFGPARTAPRGALPACTGEIERSRIYPPFFHGPSFQVLEAAGPLDASQAVAIFRDPTESHFGAGKADFTSQPMLTEALFQTCGLATMITDRVMALPAGITRLEIFHHGPMGQEVRLVGRPAGRDAAGNRTFDADAVSRDGTVLVKVHGYAMVETGPAPALPTRSAVSSPALPKANVELPQLEDVHFAAVSVEAKPAERSWFSNAERVKYAGFTVQKRADEWRAGRLAAKRAALETHKGLGPLDVEVVADTESGRPRLVIQGQESALWLSISHRAGLAIAALSPAPIGVDLETIEDRERSFLEEAFSVAELKAMLDSEMDPKLHAACLWSAKEAALKRAGVGLKADLRAHQVTSDDSGGALVEGPSGRFGVRFYQVAQQVLAVSSPQLDPPIPAKA